MRYAKFQITRHEAHTVSRETLTASKARGVSMSLPDPGVTSV
jgi:hypothetical protein